MGRVASHHALTHVVVGGEEMARLAEACRRTIDRRAKTSPIFPKPVLGPNAQRVWTLADAALARAICRTRVNAVRNLTGFLACRAN